MYCRTDRLFAGLLVCQWLAAVLTAQWISPRAWAGAQSSVHPHVWIAVFLGGAVVSFPVFPALFQPGRLLTHLELAYEIAPNVPDALVGDLGRLRQVIINLVGNSIKFTDHGEVVVQVQLDDDSNGQARIHFLIRDTGIGIPEDKRQAIFNAFEQADTSTSRKYGGTGLGLAICSQLVQKMQGRIWVDSVIGEGSTFHFTACLGIQQSPVVKIREIVPPKLQGEPVLVVDDNATNRRLLDQILTNWGMKPTIVSSGLEAMAALDRAVELGAPYVLVVLDAMMPEMDGFAVAQRVRQHPHYAKAAVLMLSSAGATDDANRCRQLGLDGYLTKPIIQKDLLEAIIIALHISMERKGEAQKQPEAPERGRRHLRILLAEDNVVNQILAVHLLEKRDHCVVVANNGQEAVAAWESQKFDLVLMDVQMPEVSGFEATALIREKEKATGVHTPIIALTARAMKGDRERCLEAGMDDRITNPIQTDELWQAIDRLLGAVAEPPPAPTAAKIESPPEAVALPAYLRDNPKLLKKIVTSFLVTSQQLLADLRVAVEHRDAAKLGFAAHSLKGSVGNFGAQMSYDLALELETMGKGGDLPHAARVLAQLEQAIEQVCLRLNEIVAHPESAPRPRDEAPVS